MDKLDGDVTGKKGIAYRLKACDIIEVSELIDIIKFQTIAIMITGQVATQSTLSRR